MTDQTALTLASADYDLHQIRAAISDLAARLDRCDGSARAGVAARQLRHLRRMLDGCRRHLGPEIAAAQDRVESMEPAPF